MGDNIHRVQSSKKLIEEIQESKFLKRSTCLYVKVLKVQRCMNEDGMVVLMADAGITTFEFGDQWSLYIGWNTCKGLTFMNWFTRLL